jgi:hypothetical protein
MIVCIAGMPRSGSTFSFNVAREALCARGRVHHDYSTSVLDELARAVDVDHVLIKAHQLDDRSVLLGRYGAMRVICTVRKPEDAVASWMQMFNASEEETIAGMRAWLQLYRELKPFALTIRYRTIDRHPLMAAWQIMRFLFPRATIIDAWRSSRRYSKAEVKKRTDAMMDRHAAGIKEIGSSWYDINTHFHRRHVSSLKSRAAIERLPLDQVERIRIALAREIAGTGLDQCVS